MKSKRPGTGSLKVGLQILNVSLILIMIYIFRLFLVKLFYMINYLFE